MNLNRLVVVLLGVVTTLIGFSMGTTTAGAVVHAYDGTAVARVEVRAYAASEAGFAQVAAQQEGSASPSETGRSPSTTPLSLGVATNTADDIAAAVSRPAGVADDFVSQAANSGKGTVWRPPGTTGNAGTVRIMEPTAQYPNGYVRFYNEGGQPIGLNGMPGPNPVTHIPLNPDGTYSIPKGWGAG